MIVHEYNENDTVGNTSTYVSTVDVLEPVVERDTSLVSSWNTWVWILGCETYPDLLGENQLS